MTLRGLLTPLALGALALALVAAWAGSAREADAHAILIRSDPGINAELADSPSIVTAFFSEGLDQRLSSMEVVDGTGERVDDGTLTFGPEAERMAVGMDDELGPGYYTVIWETLSTVDGHLLKGSFPFTVLEEDGGLPPGQPFSAGSFGGEPKPLNVGVKWALLVVAAMMTGSLAFVAMVSNPASAAHQQSRSAARRRGLLTTGVAAAALVVVAGGELLVQADQLGGFEFVDASLKTDWGEHWIQRQMILAGIIASLAMIPALHRVGRDALARSATWGCIAAGAGYLLLIAVVSHQNAVPGAFWGVGADWLHLLATAVWLGTLSQLGMFLIWLRARPSEERAALLPGHLERFSYLAATSVVVLIASGTLNALIQIPSLEALVDTAYGRSLMFKLAVVALLLIVAGMNAFYLRDRTAEEGEDSGPEADRFRGFLRRAVWVELGVGIAVLFAASFLFQYPTSRQAKEADAAAAQAADTQAVVGYEELQPAGDLTINLTISPAATGNNSFRVFLFPQGNEDIGDVQRVRLRFQPPSDDLAPSQLDMEQAELTAYRAVGPFITEEGLWTIGVDVRRAGMDDVSADFPVSIEGAGGGGQFALPLASGSWWTVAAVLFVVGVLLLAVWSPCLPEWPDPAPRLLRVGTAAFTVIGIGVLAISLLPGEGETTGNPIASSPTSIAIGRSLYEANCQQCHGADGRGDGPLAEDLPLAPADFRIHVPFHQDEFFFLVISNGLGQIMPGYQEQLTEEEIWHLINFLRAEFGVDADQPTE
ncbi:MAG TPA: CopD family protein [Dehalococcoidia bacterium]|nr:CopD family protein [Dehalococcoidia bacterium]